MFLYRAVDKAGNTVDFQLTKRRNKLAAHRFLLKAISNNSCPKVINKDKSGANKEAVRTYNKRCLKKIRIRQCKYLNNRVEGDHRFIKLRTQPMLGFKNFESASRTLSGKETVTMIKKQQIKLSLVKSLQIILLINSISSMATEKFLLLCSACEKAYIFTTS
jgi:putative transposase